MGSGLVAAALATTNCDADVTDVVKLALCGLVHTDAA
jgi:hypothetical protein